MIDLNITEILSTVSGILLGGGGLGAWFYKKQNKRLKDAEAKLAEINVEKASLDFEKERVNHLHEIIENYNKTEVEHSKRISELNHVLNVKEDELRDKTMQIRNLTDKMYASEQEVNRVQNLLNDEKDKNIRLTEERDRLEAVKCVRTDCRDPRGPKPPRKNQKTATNDNEKAEGSK